MAWAHVHTTVPVPEVCFYSSDRTEIWNASGEAVALGMQSVAIFG